jgi:phthalate 3,4-dioxygenase ferredoxin reductase subunit
VTRIVIVGASLAGMKTAEALRALDCGDEIVIVGAESVPPYDRPPLSKSVLTEGWNFPEIALDGLSAGTPEAEYVLGRRAESVDVEQHTVALADKTTLRYDTLVVATGAHPRRLAWPDLDGICYLRTYDDAIQLRSQLLPGRRVVVVGGGFIGAEAAAAAHHLGLDVTILEALPAPLSRVLGTETGERLAELHTARGVDVRCGVVVTGVEGTDRVERVHLATGEAIPADVVIVGIGAVPTTDWLESSGLVLDDGLLCDEYSRAVGTDNIYGVGDVARWLNPFYGEAVRVEHWTNAVEQAMAVAQAIMGDPQPYEHIPYVWSHQYEHKIQMVGRILPAHRPVLVRSRSDAGFVALYSDGNSLSGAVVVDRPRLIPRMKRLIQARGTVADALLLAEAAVTV